MTSDSTQQPLKKNKKNHLLFKTHFKAAFLWPSGCLINMLFNTSLILYANFLHQCKTTSHTVKNQPKRKNLLRHPTHKPRREWDATIHCCKSWFSPNRQNKMKAKNRADASTLVITKHLTCPPMPLCNLHSQQNREKWLPTGRLKSFENNPRPWGQLEVAAKWEGQVLNWLQNSTRGWTERW